MVTSGTYGGTSHGGDANSNEPQNDEQPPLQDVSASKNPQTGQSRTPRLVRLLAEPRTLMALFTVLVVSCIFTASEAVSCLYLVSLSLSLSLSLSFSPSRPRTPDSSRCPTDPDRFRHDDGDRIRRRWVRGQGSGCIPRDKCYGSGVRAVHYGSRGGAVRGRVRQGADWLEWYDVCFGSALSYERFRFDIIYAVMANKSWEMAKGQSSVVTGFA